jgi:hypothetical protein
LTVAVADREAVARLVGELAVAGAAVYRVTPRRPTLEELFVRIVEAAGGGSEG